MICSIGSILAFSVLALGADAKQESIGYLWNQVQDGKGGVTRTATPYVPREGDLLLFDDMSPFWTRLYKIAGTAPPFHAGIVMKKPDGQLAVLESGPDDTLHVFILDVQPRLLEFVGSIQVRQAKRELTKEESEKLTNFSMAQEGKRYAMWRLLLQGTHFRHRGGVKEKIFATTYMDRHRWLCAEIVVTAATIVGLMDPQYVKGTVTYPLDMVDDVRFDLSGQYGPTLFWGVQK